MVEERKFEMIEHCPGVVTYRNVDCPAATPGDEAIRREFIASINDPVQQAAQNALDKLCDLYCKTLRPRGLDLLSARRMLEYRSKINRYALALKRNGETLEGTNEVIVDFAPLEDLGPRYARYLRRHSKA